MHVVYPIWAGIDVHQTQVSVCLRRVVGAKRVTLEEQVFETTKSALGNLVGWLKARDCPIVGRDGQFTGRHALLIRLSLVAA